MCQLDLAVVLTFGLLTDVADGILARRFGTQTLELRRIDTRVDMVFYGCAATVALLSSNMLFWQCLPSLVGYFIVFLLRNGVDYLRYGESPSYHMWSGKVWSVCLFLFLFIFFLDDKPPIGLEALFIVYAFNAVEGIISSLVLPLPCHDIPTVWHALILNSGSRQGSVNISGTPLK